VPGPAALAAGMARKVASAVFIGMKGRTPSCGRMTVAAVSWSGFLLGVV